VFLLVLAHPGRAGPKAVKPVVCVCVLPPTLISCAVVTVQ